MAEQRVDVFVEHRPETPVCQKRCARYDLASERVWRHLYGCQLKTFLAHGRGWAGSSGRAPGLSAMEIDSEQI